MQQQPHTIVDFSDEADAFININTEEELQNAEELSASERGNDRWL